MLCESDYEVLAHAELASLISCLDRLDSDHLSCELENEIITLEFEDDTTYVINSHRAARQIWMAAERTAWHFDWDSEKAAWIAQKTGDELWATLRRVVGVKLGQASVDAMLRRPAPAT